MNTHVQVQMENNFNQQIIIHVMVTLTEEWSGQEGGLE